MNPEDYRLLEMLPPSNNHDVFHNYVTMDGRLTPKGEAFQKFAREMTAEAFSRRMS